jgi:4-amino-4-deoxy-L-arabinose transferase-like glycosyltransferase
LTKTLKKYLPEIIFIAGMFFVYLLWAGTIPFNRAPDEYMKWDLIRYVFNTGVYPPGYEPALISPLYGNSYAFEPALVYLADALMVRIWSFFSSDTNGFYMAARVISAIISCGAVFIFFRIGKRLFSNKTAWLFAAGIALLPQYTYLSSYINNDIFGIFCVSLMIYFCVRGIQSKWAWRDCLGLGVGAGLCLLSYYYAYPMLFGGVFFFLATMLLFVNRGIKTGVIYVQKTAVVILMAAAIAGWYFVRNLILYNGDLFAMDASRQCAELNAIPAMKPSARATPQNMGLSFWYMLVQMGWVKYSAASAFGVFGYMTVLLPVWMYMLFYIVLFAGSVLGFRIKKLISAPAEWKFFSAALFIGAAGTIALSLFYSYTQDFQPQGRYLLQAVIPFACLFCLGVENASRKLKFPVQYALIGVFGVLNCIAYIYLHNAMV